MSRWFRMYDDLVDDPKVQRLAPDLFKAELLAALRGADNVFSKYVKAFNGRPSRTEWLRLIRLVFARDDYTCRYCGASRVVLECDHIHPVSRGGESTESNLATACKPCNRKKRAKTLDELGWALK